MKSITKHRNSLLNQMELVLKSHKEASLVAYRYRTLRASLIEAYPNLVGNTDKEVMMNFLKDVVYLDRKLRKLTEGIDEENKEIESQRFQLEELGAEVNLKQNIKELKQL